jgi:uncharacterized protein (DUF302 family)
MNRIKISLLAVAMAGAALTVQAADNPYLAQVPKSAGPLQLPASMNQKGVKPYEMSGIVTRAEKAELMRQLIPMMKTTTRLDAKDVMNLMTTKYKAKKGLTFDDVVTSMNLRGNQLNFKLVGHSAMWKDIQAVLGDTAAPRMEVFHWCDIAAGREVLKFAPEAIVYLPCRIAVMEDNNKDVWVLTLDWDTAWLDSITDKMGTPDVLVKAATDIREKMDIIMRAAADGDL